MKVYTNNTFQGHYPVGTAAVVYANSAEEAAEKLEKVLRAHGLEQEVPPASMQELAPPSPVGTLVRILCDGEY